MGRRSNASELSNRIRLLRADHGLSQQELAERAGITRQAVNAIEAGSYVPNTVVALRLARALQSRVEDLFQVPNPVRRKALPSAEGAAAGSRFIVGRVGERLVSQVLRGERGVAEGFLPADGILGEDSMAELVVPEELVERTVFLVGCDPSLGILAARVSRSSRDCRLVWVTGSSQAALDALRHNTAHIAGIHLRDPKTGDFNHAQARKALGRGGVVVSYTAWEQGLMVRRGNPHHIGTVGSLGGRDVRLVNRDTGSGSRALLDQLLKQAGVSASEVKGYESIARGHIDVARRVAEGNADVGVGLRAVADIFDLDFLPLADARFDFLIPNEHLGHPAIQQMLELLQGGGLRRELAALEGYDIGELGTIRHRFGVAA